MATARGEPVEPCGRGIRQINIHHRSPKTLLSWSNYYDRDEIDPDSDHGQY